MLKKVVIIPGGFHPFHAGHKALYDAAVAKFPKADVFIAATDDKSKRPFPFKLKKQLAGIAGIPAHRFVQVKSPFQPKEITGLYNPEDTQLIFVRSDKDSGVSPLPGGFKKDGSASYLQPLKRGAPENMNQHGFMTYLPTVQFGPGMTSATEIRAKWAGMSDEEKADLVNNLYPMSSAPVASKAIEIFNNVLAEEKEVVSMPMGSLQEPEEEMHPIKKYVRDKEARLKSKEVEEDMDPKGPEVTIGDYTTRNFYMCGGAIETAEKFPDNEGMGKLIRLQDLMFGLEADVMNGMEATDEVIEFGTELTDAIMDQAKVAGIEKEVGEYQQMHLDAIKTGDPEPGYGRVDTEEED